MNRALQSGAGAPHRRRRRLRACLVIVLTATVGLVLAGTLSSCRREHYAPQTGGLALLDVPTIRVRITPAGISQEDISTTGGYRLFADGRCVLESGGPLGKTALRRQGGLWRLGNLSIPGWQLVMAPTDGVIRCGLTAYRGSLRMIPTGADGFAVVNHVDLESYLAGVLPRELYPSWSPQTYHALAVAARTFALYNMRYAGAPRDYDVGDDQGWQVYGGFSAETEKSRWAVGRSHGVVLAFGPPGGERIFLPQYSACCGGIVNGAEVIRDAAGIQPLRGGQKCQDCQSCPRYRWPPLRVGKEEIAQALSAIYPAAGSLGGVATIRVASTTPYGRAVWLDVVGRNGQAMRLRAEDLRLSLLRNGTSNGKTLPSMNCRIRDVGDAMEFSDGRGFGHGVGLCQWGAQGKAEVGWSGEEILRYYYPGAMMFRVY